MRITNVVITVDDDVVVAVFNVIILFYAAVVQFIRVYFIPCAIVGFEYKQTFRCCSLLKNVHFLLQRSHYRHNVSCA